MSKLNHAYKSIINPVNLITCFKTKQDFIKWLDMGSKKDLEYTLKEFEQAELYEYCVIIRDKIKNDFI